MKLFLLKIAAWLSLVLALHLIAACFADGTADEYYLRFTGNERQALVLGTSRAAQGIDPSALDHLLPRSIQVPGMLNFGFTIGHSPYGPAYFNAIRKKLDPATKHGLFIVCVDPWALSIPKGSAITLDGPYPEDERMLGKQWWMTGTPNIEYLVRNYGKGWGSLVVDPIPSTDAELLLHPNGRLEVQVEGDEDMEILRRLKKVEVYERYAEEQYEPAPFRVIHLTRTIELLKEHGTVFMVRLPIHKDILDIESFYWPGFSSEMEHLANALNVAFLDHSGSMGSLRFTDGNHIAAVSVPDYSQRLANEIGTLLDATASPGSVVPQGIQR
jgi:hypothetical protein